MVKLNLLLVLHRCQLGYSSATETPKDSSTTNQLTRACGIGTSRKETGFANHPKMTTPCSQLFGMLVDPRCSHANSYVKHVVDGNANKSVDATSDIISNVLV